MRLTLVRHGQTPSNVAGLLDTAPPGPGLTALGRSQADAVVPALADEPIDAVFASNQLRAQQTATPLATARGLGLGIEDDLREISAGDLELAGDPDSIHRYIGTLRAWLEGDLRRRIPGGPTGSETLERLDTAIDRIAGGIAAGGSAVAVSHGAAIRLWAASRASNLDTATAGARHLDNTGAVTLQRVGGRWEVVTWRERALADTAGGPLG